MITLQCSVGEGGGGILRAALPLSLFLKIPLRFTRFRAGRSEPGIGWPHKWLLDGICRWTGSHANPTDLGTTDFTFEPGALEVKENLTLDYDDLVTTFLDPEIVVVRRHLEASDHFLRPMNSVGGKAVRGHSVATPLICVLSMMIHNQGQPIIAEIAGGTETPGAPFVDALDRQFVTALNGMGASLSLEVIRRGCIGGGGGAVRVYAGSRSNLASFVATPQSGVVTAVEVEAIFYVYGDEDYFQRMCEAYAIFVIALNRDLNVDVVVRPIFVPYFLPRYQQLFMIRNGSTVRDVSVCYEEIDERERHHFGLPLALARLRQELRHCHLQNRFTTEQLIPVVAAIPGASEFYTERITKHTESVIEVVKTVTGREVLVESLGPDLVKIVVTAE